MVNGRLLVNSWHLEWTPVVSCSRHCRKASILPGGRCKSVSAVEHFTFSDFVNLTN